MLQERVNYFNYIPLFLSVGISIYFNLAWELTYITALLLIAISILMLYIHPKLPSFYLFTIIAGFSISLAHTHLQDTKFIAHPIQHATIKGTISSIVPNAGKWRLTITDVANTQEDIYLPNTIRLAYRGDEILQVGDTVSATANLYPPMDNIIPNGFDFHMHFYFKGIGAIGYIINDSLVVTENRGSHNRINIVRNNIDKQLYKLLDNNAAALIAALITGNGKGVAKKLQNDIQHIGIAHIFAISGMHMGIVIYLSYIFWNRILTHFCSLMLRFNVIKISSFLAMLSGFFYLAIAGFAVSAQRAFIMACVILIAKILDYKCNIKRVVNIAAVIILVLEPYALFSPSFQMSFAACFGLIFVFELLRNWLRQLPYSKHFIIKLWRYFLTLNIATLTATIFTMPFVMYHFQQISIVGLFANIVIIPFVEFVLLPICLLFLLTYFVGISWIMAWPLKFSSNIILQMITFFSNLPMDNLYIAKMSLFSMALIACATFLLCTLHIKAKYLAMPIIAAILFYEAQTPSIEAIIYTIKNKSNSIVYKKDNQYLYTGYFSYIEQEMLAQYLHMPLQRSDEKNHTLKKRFKINNDHHNKHGIYLIQGNKHAFFNSKTSRAWHNTNKP